MPVRGPILSLALLVFAMPVGFVVPTLADDMPSRKPGLWEMNMSRDNGRGPGQTMKQCVDGSTDQMMQLSSGPNPARQCKRDVQRSGDSITIDSTCTRGGKTRTSHAVVTGSFDSAYTTTITAQGEGGQDGRTITVAAKWLGPCTADQKPGDMIMGNGMKFNILEARRRGSPPGAGAPNQ